MKENIIAQINIAAKLESRLKANQEPVKMKTDFQGITFSEQDPESFEVINTIKTTLLEQSNKNFTIPSFENIDLTTPFEKAALSGKVEPAALFGTGVTEQQKQLVLSVISKDFNIEATDKVRWTLKPEKRTPILSEMIANGTIQEKVIQPLPATDLFGEMLRKIMVEGKEMKLDELSADQLKATLTVMDLTTHLDFSKPEIDQVTEHIKPAGLMDDYSTLSNHFIGREDELIRLYDFLINQHSTVNGPHWRGMIITGEGGVGKSTLLAKFIGDIKSLGKATVIILDFDRPGINPEDSVWLEREITRQVGLQYPQFEKRLKMLRDESRLFGSNQGIPNLSYSGSEESSRYSKSLIYEVRYMLESVSTEPVPFLLVFDTIEEASQRFLIGRLYEWINYLADIMSGISMRVIFSGRLYDNSLTEIQTIPQVIDSLEINEFDQAIAQQFLEKHGVKPDTARNILQSGSVPQRPLELKLVAKLLSEGAMSEKELLKDLRENRDSTGEFFAGIIYRRVLMRINDPVLQKLAYPGLILRYLTPEIILNVLCPVLQISIANLEEAGNILQKLASYNWLCYTDSYGKVWHRKDLRRSMIRFMELHEPERILAVRTKAIDYFNSIDTKELSAESTYHQLMMLKDPVDGEKFDLNELQQAYEFIFSNLNDLPKSAEVLIKFAADQNVPDKEVFCLPDKFLYAKYHPTGKSLVKSREYFNAYQLFQRAKKKNNNWDKVLNVTTNDWNDNWEQELLFATVEWDKARKLKSYQRFFGFQQAEFSLLEYVYPGCFINPGDINTDEFTKRLNNFIVAVQSNSGTDSFFRYQIFFNRFSSALVIMANQGLLDNSIIKLIEKAIEHFSTKEKSGSIEKSRFLLNCIIGNTVTEKYRISHSQLKLDSEWLLKLSTSFIGQPSDQSIRNEEALNALAKICDVANVVSSKNLLSQFDTQYSNMAAVTDLKISLFEKDPNEIFSLLEGPSLLFRDPCRYALLDAFTTYKDYEKLAEIIQGVLTVKLADLDPNIFALGLTGNRELALEPFIEIIDRSWAMESFLTAACAAKPRNNKLITVHNAFHSWRDSLRNCMNQQNKTNHISNFSQQQLNNTFMATANLQLKASFAGMKRLGDLVSNQFLTERAEALERAGHEPTTGSEAFEGRNGYTPDFLDGWEIPMPQLKDEFKDDMRQLRRGGTGVELRYQNFSVIMSVSRKLPIITAVNINGAESKKVPRISVWSFDGRLDKEDQVGDSVYDNNILDRGHMVRREDPNWGDEAVTANRDTFHFTNSCPQIANINQQTWLGLENYVLSHAKSDDMMVNVYTGPVFSDQDMIYRDVQIPAAFWKVVTIVTEEGRPSATAYKISQEKELGDLEFVYSAYKTFQISIQEVIDLTGIDFSALVEFDGFTQQEIASGQRTRRKLESLSDIMI